MRLDQDRREIQSRWGGEDVVEDEDKEGGGVSVMCLWRGRIRTKIKNQDRREQSGHTMARITGRRAT